MNPFSSFLTNVVGIDLELWKLEFSHHFKARTPPQIPPDDEVVDESETSMEIGVGDEDWFRGQDGVFRVNPFKIMYPYQRAGVRMLNEFGGRALLGDEMG